jgi:hypothetical protein
MASGTWIKRFILGLFAAIAALVFSKKRATAPGKEKDKAFTLPPVPDARASGPEDATPLTEDEQAMMAERAPTFRGFEAPAREAMDAPAAPGLDESTPLTEDEQAAFAERMRARNDGETPAPISYEIAKENADAADALREAGDTAAADALEQRIHFAAPSDDASETPAPISYEIAKENADTADALREAGDTAAADALEQRIYFAAPSDDASETPAPISYEIAKENADAADALREAGDTAAADALDQRIYFAAPSDDASESPAPGDTAPEPTSEAFDIVTDGADHTGQAPADIEDPTSVGLDIDVDLDDDEDEIVPELTSEAFDAGSEALGIAAGEGDTSGRGFITVPDEQTWCPDEFPIKGNASSRIYHKPGESSYDATNPEICFASDQAAAAQGFRPRKR